MKLALAAIRTPLLIAGLALLAACASTGGGRDNPGAEWQAYASPAAAGFNAGRLEAADALVRTGNTLSMMVIEHGKVAYAYGPTEQVTYLASVRKSILSMLYGRYVKDGTIDLDATLADIGIDDVGGLSARERSARVRDIISARSGIYHPASNGGDSTADAPPRDSQAPGSYYLYNNWDFNAAGAIFEGLTGKDIYDELRDRLAVPLGFQDFDRAAHEKSGDAERSEHLAYHMHLSTRDLARIGQLMLQKGLWDGNRLIDRDWIAESTAMITTPDEMHPQAMHNDGYGYGYMWWIVDPAVHGGAFKGAYAARGHFGMYLLVLPELDMVISLKTLPQKYETPEEYDAIRVSWPQFMAIAHAFVDARAGQ